jgi:hypothetical protein
MPAPTRKSEEFKDSQHTFAGVAPTNADKGSEAPTMSDNVSDTPTNADSLELVRVTARIAKRHRDRLENIARAEGRLLSDVLREAIREYLKAH